MADHLSEEEQVEAIKRWWNENWVSVVLPIILALGGYLGWNSWQDHKQGKAEQASDLYQQLAMAAEVAPGETLTEEQRAAIDESANVILDAHGGTLYADMANLLLAKIQVEGGQLDAAAARLQAVVDNGADEAIQQVAKARLARVMSAKGDHSAALSMVAQTDSESFKALFAEIRGDVYSAQGKLAEANTEYQAALDTLLPSEFNRRSLIQLKLDAVAVPGAPESAPAAGVEGDA